MTETHPRALVVADAWRGLGEGLGPFSNSGGLPLARTIKLILEPLVIRPVQRPQLSRTLLDAAAAAELTERIVAAGGDLRAAAAWFALMKRQRRARRITTGNPQDLYFQRAYELARLHGAPAEDAENIAGAEVDDVHDDARVTAAELREFLAAPDVAAAVSAVIAEAWQGEARGDEDVAGIVDLLDACASGAGGLDGLAAAGAGSAAGARLGEPGEARAAGLSERERPEPPSVGGTASKKALPLPFDRSILERLFGSIASLEVAGTAELRRLVDGEARRSGSPWQLADEGHRVVMAAGREAGRLDGGTDASRRLRDRWRREGFVRHAQRLGVDAADGAGEAFLRRLWVRLQGRELRNTGVASHEVWDVLDGAMRSVIMDRRDRVKTGLAGAGS